MTVIGAALMTTPATAQTRAAHSAPARVARPAVTRSTVIVNPGFVPRHGVPGRPFFFHHHHHHFFPRGWWPYYPAWYGGYSYPSYPLSDMRSSSDGAAAAYSQQNYQLQQELNQLYNEMQRLREQQAQAAVLPPPPSSPEPQSTVTSKSTVLVFRDGKKEQIHNYAISGRTLWVFNERRARKILLSELDIPATRKVNDERGVEFAVPR